MHENLKFKNYSTKIFLKKFTVITERFSLSDFNRQIVIDFSTHEMEGIARIFSFNFWELNETLGISGFSIVFLYFKIPTKTIASFTFCTLADEFIMLRCYLRLLRIKYLIELLHFLVLPSRSDYKTMKVCWIG